MTRSDNGGTVEMDRHGGEMCNVNQRPRYPESYNVNLDRAGDAFLAMEFAKPTKRSGLDGPQLVMGTLIRRLECTTLCSTRLETGSTLSTDRLPKSFLGVSVPRRSYSIQASTAIATNSALLFKQFRREVRRLGQT